MKLDFKTIIGFVVIGVVAYLCRPLNDKITDVFIEDNNDKVRCNINGHDYVDLGLSVKWATCNIGATKPEEYGDYFAWGETEPKESYDINHYLWNFVDAANAQWEGSWRMPTKGECDELIDKCTWKWTTVNRVNGYKITANNGNWIFLPAAGYRNGTSIYSVGSYGYYWSSTVYGIDSNYAYFLYFYSSGKSTGNYNRRGRTVRPVTE